LVLNRQLRVAELDAAGLGGCQAGFGTIGNHATFLLCESRVNVQRERIDIGLSVREYRTEPAYLVVLWARGAPMWSLGQFVDALRRPHFTLYFGRKACPLSVPLDPRTVEADDPSVNSIKL
jgi:hypothetical protein